MKRAKFIIWKSSADSQWYWHLKAKNGEVICQSEGYRSKYNARKGIKSVRRNALFAKEETK